MPWKYCAGVGIALLAIHILWLGEPMHADHVWIASLVLISLASFLNAIPNRFLKESPMADRMNPRSETNNDTVCGYQGHLDKNSIIFCKEELVPWPPLAGECFKAFTASKVHLSLSQSHSISYHLYDMCINCEVSLLVPPSNSTSLKDLILKCSRATGDMMIPPVKLEVTGGPVFLKRLIIPYGLREPVTKVLNELVEKCIVEPTDSSLWATSIVTPLNSDGKTSRIRALSNIHVLLLNLRTF
ncbi:uncharacterized protein DEA37_0012956 [Paragonimus westermani]|uniref:Uncharacterized protein n=1 Tax=Paragonimus westermani TaxID=34504 RepID=A0A5J4NGD1_9TREM|nr:uncharacterized protein DEA37_0012956 [Paragonimus westermani]